MSGASKRTSEGPPILGSSEPLCGLLGPPASTAFGPVVGPTLALWSGTNKNRDVSTGPLARLFARSVALLTRSLAPGCSLRSLPPLRSLVCSLVHFAHSLARGTVNY